MTGKHTESTRTTEEDHHIPDYEDHKNEVDTRSPTYEIEEQDRGHRGNLGYNGYENEITTKWYHPKTTDSRVVPPESEFFATVVGTFSF